MAKSSGQPFVFRYKLHIDDNGPERVACHKDTFASFPKKDELRQATEKGSPLA